ncbi:hypothetical protein E4T63_23440 [Pseudomonas fluorescens]|uniref:Uncharacterized protein n=1 Tax=Pseudomonas fluorescens TaxID=294 RepID=A0AAP8Z209_PSEFL|nr:hypothetical protein E4T63_23440 [Pseudomonas fluorescens]
MSLLAIAIDQSTWMLNVRQLSRAGSLLQVQVALQSALFPGADPHECLPPPPGALEQSLSSAQSRADRAGQRCP